MLQIEKSALAKEDLINIWLYGLEHYGETQADFYFDRLEIKINSLAEHPEKYQVRNQYTPPVRICPHKSHIVIYTIDNGVIYIVRVLGSTGFFRSTASPSLTVRQGSRAWVPIIMEV